MSFFFFYQAKGGEEAWQCGLADSREAVTRDAKPTFVTVLDVDAAVDDTMTTEQIRALKYRGPMYADFDGELADVIGKVQEFAGKLREEGVDLDCCHWYATGGRGFHVEIPVEVFMEKAPVKGIAYYPAILKEVAYAVYVDTLDLRVYSARRGRMWRTTCNQRDNGLYKVAITATELDSMTVERYLEICKAPRHVEVKAPVYSHKFAVLYAKAAQKVDNSVKTKKSAEGDKKILARFGGKFPPSLAKVMEGGATNPDTGFHNIALQIAITANALNKSEAETVAACAGLFESHVSAGTRYNTPAKRKAELERLLRYTEGNICYEFAKNAVKAICDKAANTADLDGAAESAGQEMAAAEEDDNGLLGSVSMRETGIFCKDSEGLMKAISNLSFSEVHVLKNLPDGDAPASVWGFEAVVNVKGKPVGRQLLNNDTFSSRQKFNGFAMKVAGIMSGNDVQTTAVTQLLHQMAEKESKVEYILKREGVDLVFNPDRKEYDLLWVSGGGVQWAKPEQPPYSFRSLNGPLGLLKSRLAEEEMLSEGTAEEEAVIRAMLKMNDPQQLLKLIGWMTSCFHRRLYARVSGEFPLCHVYGQAGAGKTQTTTLLATMHYGADQTIAPLSADRLTTYAIERFIVASSSIPVLVDEWKPRQMDPKKVSGLKVMLRSVWNDGLSSRGGGADDGGAKDFRVLTQEVLSSPVVLIGEAIEAESAIMERSVIVNLSKGGIEGRKQHFDHVYANRDTLAKLGKLLMTATLTLTLTDKCAEFKETRLDPALKEARDIMGPNASDRPVYSFAVALAGFEFFSECIRSVFGNRLDEELAVVRESSRIEDAEIATHNQPVMAEASKVLDMIAFISRTESGFSQIQISEGKEYAFHSLGQRKCVDIKMQETYIKYVSWAKAKGQEILYDNYQQFFSGLANYRPRISTTCLDSKLQTRQRVKIYRFDLELLQGEGVSEFHGQEG